MSLETVDALVVKSVDFSESSLILDLFTRELGKIEGIAKGAKRLKNPFETSLDLLASIRLSFIRKSSDSLDILTEAKLKRRFRPTSRNLRGLYAGYAIAELLDKTLERYQPYPELWIMTESTFERLQKSPNIAERFVAYQLYLLDALGLFPSTRACVECGEELPLDEVTNLERRIFVDVAAGGVICSRCRSKKRAYELTPTTIGAFKAIEAGANVASRVQEIARAVDAWRRAQALSSEGLPTIDLLEKIERADVAFERLDAEAFAPFSQFSASSRRACCDLLARYFCAVLRRRPRTFAYLPFIMSDPTFTPPRGEEEEE